MSETIDELIKELINAAQCYGISQVKGDESKMKEHWENARVALVAFRAAIAEKDAEIERLKGVIRKVEWVNLTDGDGNFAYQECSECGYSREHGHHQDCPFRGWEGGE